MTESEDHKEVPAIDPTVVETVKIRPNGMVRYAREWVPITKELPEHLKELCSEYLDSRLRVPYKFPVAQTYYRSRYGDLSDEHVMALDDYMNGHGQVGLHGDDLFWVFEVKMDDLKAYIEEVAIEQGYESFDHYHSWYKENVLSKEPDRGRPEGAETVWPVILDSYRGEGIQDGLHRFHQYVDAGVEVVPAIAFVDEYSFLRAALTLAYP